MPTNMIYSLKDKIPIFQIAKYTNLSVDEIKKLR